MTDAAAGRRGLAIVLVSVAIKPVASHAFRLGGPPPLVFRAFGAHCPVLAINGCSAVPPRTSDVGQKTDLRTPTSAFCRIASASGQRADAALKARFPRLLTLCGHWLYKAQHTGRYDLNCRGRPRFAERTNVASDGSATRRTDASQSGKLESRGKRVDTDGEG